MNAMLQYRKKRQLESQLRSSSDPQNLLNRVGALKALASSIMLEVNSIERVQEALDQNNVDLTEEVRRFEIDLIRNALIRTGGNQAKAAKLLNIKSTTLHEKIKRHRIADEGVFTAAE